jgi:spore maturation protein CgeB
VPLWNDANDLVNLVRRWLPDEEGRRSMAARAHARAVPGYSILQRAASVVEHIKGLIATPNAQGSDIDGMPDSDLRTFATRPRA